MQTRCAILAGTAWRSFGKEHRHVSITGDTVATRQVTAGWRIALLKGKPAGRYESSSRTIFTTGRYRAATWPISCATTLTFILRTRGITWSLSTPRLVVHVFLRAFWSHYRDVKQWCPKEVKPHGAEPFLRNW